MRLKQARIQKYRSIKDTGWFDVELGKTILVGPNESGKTAILQALQHLNPPEGFEGFDELRDYPRSEYNDITTGAIDPNNVEVVTGSFELEDEDKRLIPEEYHKCIYVFTRKLNNETTQYLKNGPKRIQFSEIKNDLIRLASHVDKQVDPEKSTISNELNSIIENWFSTRTLTLVDVEKLSTWLKKNLDYVDEDNGTEINRYDKLDGILEKVKIRGEVISTLRNRLPVFVLFSNYFRVKPLIHLNHLAERIENNLLDDDSYDYGNKCLLQLLGFSARELSDLGNASEPSQNDITGLKEYRDQLDKRHYQLNAASVKLTREIQRVWSPDSNRDEADRIRVTADGQYLKVVVEDDLGVEIELDQRSEGFQWLVSFFVVFFAEAADKHENAILLLDEPGLSLHGLKQREFRKTISELASTNQTLYTTHSPFLVGPNELDFVRVVEMTDRNVGTNIHTTITASDPAGLLPLQEALGYDLAQSLFGQTRNLILEGLTDYWYLEAMSELLNSDSRSGINKNIAFVPASSASKVVYFATILHAQKLRVAALLDSDNAGEAVANQDTLVHTLGNNRILRTKDYILNGVNKPEIEDLLRDTLTKTAKSELGWDIESLAKSQTNRPIIDIFNSEIKGFSKYKLAKTFLKWARLHGIEAFPDTEIESFKKLFTQVNKALK